MRNTRAIRKRDLIHNDYQPQIEVDPQTYEVRADGELLSCEPAQVLPLAQRYFCFGDPHFRCKKLHGEFGCIYSVRALLQRK